MEPRHSQPDFGDSESEYRAATEAAAVFDVSDRTQLRMSGPDRRSFFHGFCTNDIKGLSVGFGCEAFLCNVKGRILGHVFVFADEDSLWIESVPGQGEALTSHLNRYHLVEDLKLVDQTETLAEFLVSGPQTVQRLADAGLNVAGLEPWRHGIVTMETDETRIDCRVKRVDIFGSCAFLISTASGHADALWQRLLEASVVPAGKSVFESLRIEAGFPVYGIDLSDENLAQEAARTERAISFQKGCYLGQEPIARLNAMGHVNRALASFVIEASEIPPVGTVLLNPKKEDKEAGRATSVAWSWSAGKPIGMGMVRALFLEPGTELPIASEPRTTATIR
ncbi:MAG: aminomethyl transferase family protein [Rhodopirellula sp.]|nr:aminomethyl transferase family protein [Rhodopirellula sp.]